MGNMFMTNEELVEKARTVVRPRRIRHGFMVGEVGCALVRNSWSVYAGVSIDTCCGMGYCAEHSSIAAMLTHGQQTIKRL